MAINRLYVFEVEGSGVFPADMLRYDSCWPSTTEDAIAVTTQRNNLRTVRLKGTSQPTAGRWSSFGWSVTDRRVEILRV